MGGTFTKFQLLRHMITIAVLSWAVLLPQGSTAADSQSREGEPAEVVEYAVIVNKANVYKAEESQARVLIKKLFLKERSKWPDAKSTEAKAFDRPTDDPAHQAFVKVILGSKEALLAQHWIDLKQKTGVTAPRKVKTENMIIKFVSKKPGAFGITTLKFAEANKENCRIFFKFKMPQSGE